MSDPLTTTNDVLTQLGGLTPLALVALILLGGFGLAAYAIYAGTQGKGGRR